MTVEPEVVSIPEETPPSNTNEQSIDPVEDESLTPPLLPNMKVKASENNGFKEIIKEVKQNNANWDMFADDHSFKKEYNVSFNVIFILHL